jgi:hypothetical protein
MAASANPASAPWLITAYRFDPLPLPLTLAKVVHALLADRGFSPPHEISYRGLKPSRVSAAFGRS